MNSVNGRYIGTEAASVRKRAARDREQPRFWPIAMSNNNNSIILLANLPTKVCCHVSPDKYNYTQPCIGNGEAGRQYISHRGQILKSN